MTTPRMKMGNERVFGEQLGVDDCAFVGFWSVIYFPAENGELGIGRAFVVHRAQARRAFVERLTDSVRPLLPLLSGI